MRIIRGLLGDAKRVAKSKSMVGEEVGLTHALRDAGIDLLETDIGEYIVDIEGRGPSHITAPAIHLNRTRIRELLARGGADIPDDDPVRLSRYVRDVVGAFFQDCDAGITGANAVVARSGRVMVVENEGNVSLGASHPKLHIVITGLEKVVADEAGALAILEVLAPSATAQPLTSFSHFLADPAPGQQRHVVFVDNGRSEIAAGKYHDVLRCIRCGACMNACPVYRAAGGLSYGAPYMGPIGAVIAPLLWKDGRYADLPLASSLCGRCTEVCPVGIPLHRMLLDLRADAVAMGQTGSRIERLAWQAWSLTFEGATRARAASALGRIGLNGGGRFVRAQRTASDPRVLPHAGAPERDTANLVADPPRQAAVVIAPEEIEPADLAELFRIRATALGVTLLDAYEPREGDRVLHATAAIAATGSVLLLGDAAARRPLLGAKRVVVHLDPATIVRYLSGLAEYLGDVDALILTGASRTADIEKQIVRGIHGSEELAVVLAGG
ncbi:MAG: LUD domain-containing protein [Dehalococcoidia bacterium]